MAEVRPEIKTGINRSGNLLSNFFDKLLVASGYVSAGILALVMLIVSYDTLARYFFQSPTMWANDIASYLLLTFSIIAAAWVLRDEGHVTIDIVLLHLKNKTRRLLNIITSSLCVLVCALFTWMSIIAGIEAFQRKTMLLSGILFPKWILLWIMAFGVFLLVIQFARRTWKFYKTTA